MIQEFSVQNFYSIREQQTLSFVPTSDAQMREQYVHEVKDGVSLLKLGIVYGSNASGKTTLLNALSYFRRIMLVKPESKNEGMNYDPFLLDKHSKDEHSIMTMTFWLNQERYVMSIEFDRLRIYEETLLVYSTARPTTLYKRSYQPETDHGTVVFGQKVGIDKVAQRAIEGNTTNNCTVMAAFGQSNVKTSKMNDVNDFFFAGMQALLSPRDTLSYNVRNELRKDRDGKKKKFLLQMLRASDFNITDMMLDEREDAITPELELVIKGAPIPEEDRIEMLRRGTIKHDEIIFRHAGDGGEYELDEGVESAGTHRSYFIKLFLANSEGTSQLLMTTHDINLLNEDYIRRDIIWFTDKNNCGATTLKRLSNLGLHKTMSPYNAYRQGKLVDLPFLGSIFLDLNKE